MDELISAEISIRYTRLLGARSTFDWLGHKNIICFYFDICEARKRYFRLLYDLWPVLKDNPSRESLVRAGSSVDEVSLIQVTYQGSLQHHTPSL